MEIYDLIAYKKRFVLKKKKVESSLPSHIISKTSFIKLYIIMSTIMKRNSKKKKYNTSKGGWDLLIQLFFVVVNADLMKL